MDIKNYIAIVEAFGREEQSPLQKDLLQKVPKTFSEKIQMGDVLGTIAVVAGGVIGMIPGMTMFPDRSFDHFMKEFFFTGAGFAAGAILGSILGFPLVFNTGDRSKSYKHRKHLEKEQIFKILQEHPTLYKEVDRFVQKLINDTPQSILDKSYYLLNYIHSNILGDGGLFGNRESFVKKQAEEVIKLISSYFVTKEKEWRNLASKFNLDPATLHQIISSTEEGDLAPFLSIETRWLWGIRHRIPAPINKESIEEASDDTIARISELSKYKK
jgi:hypothetical protein